MNFKDLSPLEFDDSLIININKLLTTINLKIPNFSLNYLKPRQRPSKSAKAILFFSNRDEEKKLEPFEISQKTQQQQKKM